MKARFAAWALRVMGWTVVGTVPKTGVLVGAPHTCNWDFVMAILVAWQGDLSPRILVKKEMFRWPIGWFFRALGGIPTDRANPGELVRRLLAEAASGQPFLIVVAPEGTRSRGTYWKSGFWRLARAADVPMSFAFLDGPTRTVGFGPTFHATDDVVADMDRIRAFYRDKHGIHPERRTEPRLREEDTSL